MVIPLVVPALAAIFGRQVGKSGAEAIAAEKLDLAVQLANLTPDQAQAVEAIKRQPIEEVRVRHTLGIGPLAPLPANASQRAQEIRQAKIAAAGIPLTPEESARVAAAADPKAMVEEILKAKGR